MMMGGFHRIATYSALPETAIRTHLPQRNLCASAWRGHERCGLCEAQERHDHHDHDYENKGKDIRLVVPTGFEPVFMP